jgi:hypothetical protein
MLAIAEAVVIGHGYKLGDLVVKPSSDTDDDTDEDGDDDSDEDNDDDSDEGEEGEDE